MNDHIGVCISTPTGLTIDSDNYGCMKLADCTVSGLSGPDENDTSKIDIQHLVSIIAIHKVLVDKGLISRQELLNAEVDAKAYVIKMLNRDYSFDEDRVVMDAKHCVPRVYENSNQYNIWCDHLEDYSI